MLGADHVSAVSPAEPVKLINRSKDYGNFAPFFIKAGPASHLVLRDPAHFERILSILDPIAAELEAYDKIFGMPEAALSLYSGKCATESELNAMLSGHKNLRTTRLTGAYLTAFAEKYVSILSGNLHDKMFQAGTWTQIEDTWSFLEQVITRCALEAHFGSDLFKQYPSVVRDLRRYEEAIGDYLPGMPRFMVPSSVAETRDRLLQGIEKWLNVNHSGSDFAKIEANDPEWDAFMGSKFVQDRDHVLATIQVVDLKARAAEMLRLMHGYVHRLPIWRQRTDVVTRSSACLIPLTFWTLAEVLRRPSLTKSLVGSIDRYRPSQGGSYNITEISDLELLRSVETEIQRLRMAPVAVLKCEGFPTRLDDHEQWTMPRLTWAVLCSREISLNAKVWAKSQPQIVQKPLEEFWAERFVSHKARNKSGSGQPPNGDEAPSDLHTLEALNRRIAHYQHNVMGPEYMRAMYAATLAVLLSQFEFQLCDPEGFDAAIPPARAIAYGTIKPLGNVAMRLKKRTAAGR